MKYEAKVKYLHIAPETGKERILTESYIVANAEAWFDAEKQVFEQMAKLTTQTIIPAIKISDIEDIVRSDADWFYKAKIGINDIDELTGKAKQSTVNILVQAATFYAAFEMAQDWTFDTIVDCEILSITKSKIVDIFDEDFVPKTKIEINEVPEHETETEEEDESDD